MNLYRVIPAPLEMADLGVVADLERLGSDLRPPPGPWVRAVMVASSGGNIQGVDGTSNSLTKGADRRLLALHRDSVDVVVVGARTLRTERVPLPARTPLAVVSASGDLSGHQLTQTTRGALLVLTTADNAGLVATGLHGIAHTVITVPATAPFTGGALYKALHDSVGAESVLVEGGRALYETFASITDEVALSVTPPPQDQRAGIPPWWPLPTETWRLMSLMTDDEKMLYYRYLTDVRGAPS